MQKIRLEMRTLVASMTAFEIVIELIGVVVLSCYLYSKHRQRIRRQSKRYDAAEWVGKPIDVTKLKPTVEDVRCDYLAARLSTRGILFHRSLLGIARRTVARLAYFQDRESHDPAHEHGR